MDPIPLRRAIMTCWGLAIAAAAMVWGGGAGCTGSSTSSSSGTFSTISNVAPSNTPGCPSGALFSVSPIALDNISTSLGINRLGNLNPPGHTFPTDHMYFYIKDSDDSTKAVDNVPVFAPTDITITVIASSTQESSGKTDYSITYYPCKQVQGTFGHVATLSSKLAEAFSIGSGSCTTYDPGGGNYTNCQRGVTVSVKAGEQIGTAGGPTTPSLGLDVGLFDARAKPHIFANNTRVYSNSSGFDSFHVTCFLDYFSQDLKAAALEKIHRSPGENPTCGSYNQDVAATAQGKWYLVGTASPALSSEANHLTLGIDTYNSGLGSFSIGNASVGTGVHTFTPSHTGTRNRNFPEVTADGNIYCFESLSTSGIIILIQMPTATTLTIEKLAADICPVNPAFTAAKVSFER